MPATSYAGDVYHGFMNRISERSPSATTTRDFLGEGFGFQSTVSSGSRTVASSTVDVEKRGDWAPRKGVRCRHTDPRPCLVCDSFRRSIIVSRWR